MPQILAALFLVLAVPLPATALVLDFATTRPDFATLGPGGTDMGFARFDLQGLSVEVHAQGDGFGTACDLLFTPGCEEGPGADVTEAAEAGPINCGNSNECSPFVASFSIGLEHISLSFLGVGNFGGGGNPYQSSFFLEAYDGPDGSGSLLGSVATAPVVHCTPDVDCASEYALAAVLDLSASGIRSIVFGSHSLTEDFRTTPVNLAIVDRFAMIVPEPAPGLLLTAGVLGIASWRRSLIRRRARPSRSARGLSPRRCGRSREPLRERVRS